MPGPEKYSLFNERALFLRISEGDEVAFKELYLMYDRMLYSFLLKLTRSNDMAEELLQETFLQLWLYRGNLSEVEYPRAYIHKIASSLAQRWLTRHILAKQTLQNHEISLNISKGDVPEKLALRDISAFISTIISQMPDQRRKIYLLHRERGLSSTEIASELNISSSTVRNTVSTAIKEIREKLAVAGYPLAVLFLIIL